jgi:lysophospholipase L1-like esterase
VPARPTSLQSDAPAAAEQIGAFRLGVLAFGDSITNGGGELQWGVAMQSWAMWTARALGIPYNPYAVDGATAQDVVERQIPLFERAVADRYSHYTLGCLYIGTNDVRLPGFDLPRFEQSHNDGLAFLAQRCDRLLTLTIPLDMGRPRNPTLIEQVNASIERSAAAHDALVVDLRRFGGRQVMMADHVHPTALGQVAIAEAALERLAADGLPPRLAPSELIVCKSTPSGRVRGDFTYAYRHLKQDLRLYIESRRDAGPTSPTNPER